MKHMIAAVILVIATGCATYAPAGALFTVGTMGLQANPGPTTKTGKACMQSIIGLVASGDASVEAAKAAGGITNVTVMNYEVDNFLGLIGKYCLVVKGT